MKKQSEQPTEEGQEAKPKTSRRELLRLGGAAVVGAAGMAAVTATPVSANSGGNMILGQTNTADAITILEPTTTGAIPMLEVLAHNASVPPSASQGLFAPIQGFGQTGGYDGVDGWAPGSFGYGVSGQSDSGYGVVGATLSGVDLAAFGTGRIVQAKNISTAGPPSYTPLNFEQVRDVNGVMWINLLTGWVPVQVGSPASLFTAVSTLQYSLANSDGKTWQDMDATNLNAVDHPGLQLPGHPDRQCGPVDGQRRLQPGHRDLGQRRRLSDGVGSAGRLEGKRRFRRHLFTQCRLPAGRGEARGSYRLHDKGSVEDQQISQRGQDPCRSRPHKRQVLTHPPDRPTGGRWFNPGLMGEGGATAPPSGLPACILIEEQCDTDRRVW